MNESQKNDPRFLKKWEVSGAISGMPEARMRQILSKPLEVVATCTSFKDGKPIRQTLSIGWEQINEWCKKPIIAVVVPGGNYKPGNLVSMENLPKKTKPVERVYPR